MHNGNYLKSHYDPIGEYMGLLNLLINDPLTFILLAIPLLYSIIIHELVSLNPLKHLDPIGTLMLFIFGFGWAKPVPVNFSNIDDTRKGLIFISSAGIIANMIFAFVAFLIFRLLSPTPAGVLATFLFYLAQINIILASFNLIPIPPLDGSKILMGFVSERFQYYLSRIEPYGLFIIIGLLYFRALDPLIAFFRWIILGLIGILLP